MADNSELIKALLAGVKPPQEPASPIANALAGPGSLWDTYVRPMGSASLSRQPPNWFGQNVLANPDLQSALTAASLVGPKVPRLFKGMRETPGLAAQSEARGSYFTTDPKVAEQYGKVSEFTVSARPEQFLEWEGSVPSNLRDLAQQHGLEPQATPRTLYRKMAQRIGEEEANALLRSRGYEGVRYSDHSRSEPIDNYIIFDRSKTELKSQ